MSWYIIGVNFSARESTTGVLEIKRGLSLQMEKQVTAQQHALITHTFPDYSKRPPLIWLFSLKSSRFAYSLAMSSVCWGAFLMNGAPRLSRLRKNTRQRSFSPSLFDVVWGGGCSNPQQQRRIAQKRKKEEIGNCVRP